MAFHLPPALVTDDDTLALEQLCTYFGLLGLGPYTGAYFERYAGGGSRPKT